MSEKLPCARARKNAEKIWYKQIISLKKESLDNLLNQYILIEKDFNNFREICENCEYDCSPNIKEYFEGIFEGALIKIAVTIRDKYNNLLNKNNSEIEKYNESVMKILKNFTEEELTEIENFERFSLLDRQDLQPEEIKEGLKDEGELYKLIKEYVEEMYNDCSSLQKVWQSNKDISNSLITVLLDKCRHRFKIVSDGIKAWIDESPMAMVRLFRSYEEALLKSQQLRKEASIYINRIYDDENYFNIEDDEILNIKENLEIKIANLQKKIIEKDISKEEIYTYISSLIEEKEKLENKLDVIYEQWDHKFKLLEKKRDLLSKEENHLQNLNNMISKESFIELQDEIELLKQQKEEYQKILENYEAIKMKLEGENEALKEKIETIHDYLEGKNESTLITREEAKQYELAFIGRFENKMELLPLHLINPIDKKRITIRKWRDSPIIMNDKNKISRAKISRNVSRTMPQNTRIRYIINSKLTGKIIGIIEAISFSHLITLAKAGIDNEKASLGELQSILYDIIERAERGKYFHIVGIQSPTGWTKKAINFLDSETYHKNFLNKYVYVYLVDLEENKVYYNKIYDKITKNMNIYKELYIPPLDVEKFEECKDKIMNWIKKLMKTRVKYEVYIKLYGENSAESICKSKSLAKSILVNLQKEGFGNIKHVKNSGSVFIPNRDKFLEVMSNEN